VGFVLAIFCQSMEIPVEFKRSVVIAANRPSKANISIPTDGVIDFKAPGIRFFAAKTAVCTEELTAHFNSPRPFYWLRIAQSFLPGDT
jgi:hypothetical protein